MKASSFFFKKYFDSQNNLISFIIDSHKIYKITLLNHYTRNEDYGPFKYHSLCEFTNDL